jgi:arylsulfatase A-like enzyme
MRLLICLAALVGLRLLTAAALASEPELPPGRNIIIFVADGLRADSVNATDAPTMLALRDHGVWFSNSHSLFPTFTTPNAAAIATGHYIGDTGDFSNTVYTGYRLFNAGNFSRLPANSTPFIEDDGVLADMDDHFDGNYLGEESLLALARQHGYSTAAIGKLGPVAIQDVTQLAPKDGRFSAPQTIFIDDLTGTPNGVPLAGDVLQALTAAGLPAATPARMQPAGNSSVAGVRTANLAQSMYFSLAATRAVLPLLQKRQKPFLLLYWTRDPDGTQHNQGDSLNSLKPGINGPTSRAAVHRADDELRILLETLEETPGLRTNTDIFVTSDHGFATVSKQEIDAQHDRTQSASAALSFTDVPPGFLPPGFLAMDVARFLGEPLYDPDSPGRDNHGNPHYRQVNLSAVESASETREGPVAHPALGHGLIGGSGRPLDQTDADVVIAANGGSDLIYLPRGDRALAARLVSFLEKQDYVGGLFADDALGPLPGVLPLSSIGLIGSAQLPRPAIVVAFKTFAINPKESGVTRDPLLDAVQIADTPMQQGQGMHGSFGRDNTFNFMAAAGPDFKNAYRDALPASNADIAPTMLTILGWSAAPRGSLRGRALNEALQQHGPTTSAFEHCLAVSTSTADGRGTVLHYQRYDNRSYFDEARLQPLAEVTSGCARQ